MVSGFPTVTTFPLERMPLRAASAVSVVSHSRESCFGARFKTPDAVGGWASIQVFGQRAPAVELSLQRRHVGGPFLSGWALVDQPPSLVQPGVELIQVVENNGFRRSRSPQCASIDLAVVTDNEVLQHVLDLDGKSFHPRHVSLENLQTQGDVSYELAARRVAQAARGAKLLDLADVVEDGSSNQPIPIESGVVSRNLEQPS